MSPYQVPSQTLDTSQSSIPVDSISKSRVAQRPCIIDEREQSIELCLLSRADAEGAGATATARVEAFSGVARGPAAPLPDMRRYVLSLLHT